MGLELGVALAFAGGVLSFLSPCVLPLAPPYLAYLSGQSIESMTAPERGDRLLSRLSLAALILLGVAFWRLIATEGRIDMLGAAALGGSVAALAAGLSLDAVTRRVFVSALFFVLGLATVFVTLGATASAVGRALLMNKHVFAVGAGLVIFLLGQHFIGLRKSVLTAGIMLALWAGAILLAGGDIVAAIDENRAALVLFLMLALALQYSGQDHIPLLYREARFDAGAASGRGLAGSYVIGLALDRKSVV